MEKMLAGQYPVLQHGFIKCGNGVPIVQWNGQRQCGPPCDWVGPPPPKGTELFLKRIPREWDEHRLWPILSHAGKLYNLRLMMDFSGTNRGFGFARYATTADAEAAAVILNQTKGVQVEKSSDNTRLFLGNVPEFLSEREIEKELHRHLDGVTRVNLVRSRHGEFKNFAFIDFQDHRSASMGRRALLNPGIREWGSLRADWAENTQGRGKVLRFGALPNSCTEVQVMQLFASKNVNLDSISCIKKSQNYFLVSFANRRCAVSAYDLLCKKGFQNLIKFEPQRSSVCPPQNRPPLQQPLLRNEQRNPTHINASGSQPRDQNLVGAAQMGPATIPNFDGMLMSDLTFLNIEYGHVLDRLVSLNRRYPTSPVWVLEILLGELGWGKLILPIDNPNSTLIQIKLSRGRENIIMFEERVCHMGPDTLNNSAHKLTNVLFNCFEAYKQAKMAFGPKS